MKLSRGHHLTRFGSACYDLMEHVDAKESDRGGYRGIRYGVVYAPVGSLSVDR